MDGDRRGPGQPAGGMPASKSGVHNSAETQAGMGLAEVWDRIDIHGSCE
jgi:hypothetical protein